MAGLVRRIPFPLLCIGCTVCVIVASLLVVWLLHAIRRAQVGHHQHHQRVCRLAQRATQLLDDPTRTVASVHAARAAANSAIRDLQRVNGDPSQCQLLPPRTNDLFALQQEALSATAAAAPAAPATPAAREEPVLAG